MKYIINYWWYYHIFVLFAIVGYLYFNSMLVDYKLNRRWENHIHFWRYLRSLLSTSIIVSFFIPMISMSFNESSIYYLLPIVMSFLAVIFIEVYLRKTNRPWGIIIGMSFQHYLRIMQMLLILYVYSLTDRTNKLIPLIVIINIIFWIITNLTLNTIEWYMIAKYMNKN